MHLESTTVIVLSILVVVTLFAVSSDPILLAPATDIILIWWNDGEYRGFEDLLVDAVMDYFDTGDDAF